MVGKLFDVLSLRLKLAAVTRERDVLQARLAHLERLQQQPMRPRVVPIGWDEAGDVEYRQYVP
jgi:hypothetical protein